LNIQSPYPLTESILCSFASYLATINLSPQTIKTYLPAVKHTHIILGFPDPASLSTSTLKLAQRGIARHHAQTDTHSHTRLPVTPAILKQVKDLWQPHQHDFNHIMLWAALCTAFFGFCRPGEITAPSHAAFDPNVHLLFEDLSVDDPGNPQLITLRIKQSKTDQLRTGADITLARTGQDTCPVAAILAYLAVRRGHSGPLFRFEDGKFLTQPSLIKHMREALSQLGINPQIYSGHSLRIGAATLAAANGVQDSTTKALGRWKSNAFQGYICLPSADLASTASKLADPRE
jgi:integrase